MKQIWNKKCNDNKNHDCKILRAGEYVYEELNQKILRHYGQTYREYLGCVKCGMISKYE